VRAWAAIALLLVGCGGPPASSPPQEGRGRELFLANCNKCHDYPEPTKYTATQWSRILGEMGRRAGLSPAERDEVLQYVTSR
jgi:hypothetical protein